MNSRRIVHLREGWEGRREQGGGEATRQILAEVSDHGKPILSLTTLTFTSSAIHGNVLKFSPILKLGLCNITFTTLCVLQCAKDCGSIVTLLILQHSMDGKLGKTYCCKRFYTIQFQKEKNSR